MFVDSFVPTPFSYGTAQTATSAVMDYDTRLELDWRAEQALREACTALARRACDGVTHWELSAEIIKLTDPVRVAVPARWAVRVMHCLFEYAEHLPASGVALVKAPDTFIIWKHADFGFVADVVTTTHRLETVPEFVIAEVDAAIARMRHMNPTADCGVRLMALDNPDLSVWWTPDRESEPYFGSRLHPDPLRCVEQDDDTPQVALGTV